MTEVEVKQYVKSEMVSKIESVLEGKETSVRILYVRPNDVISYMVNKGHTYDDNIDTNGWSWDYWLSFEANGKSYTLGGDGYYNSTASFSLNED